eukprot:967009_1
MFFKNVKYIDQKLLLSFDGCCDGKKVLGRLCIYHDNTNDINDKNLISKQHRKNNSQNNQNKRYDYDNDNDDKIDVDDDDDQLFGRSVFDDDETDDDDDDDDDDDERISFIQMIIVSNIIPA